MSVVSDNYTLLHGKRLNSSYMGNQGVFFLKNTNATDTAHPSPYNLYGAKYPRIEADSRVTFRFNAPNAKRVQVSIVNVPFDMVKGDDGVWTYTSEPQDKGYHNYWMIVDGAIVVDPATNAFIGYSHMCNGFEIPDPDGGFYELKDVPHGNVLIKNYYSKVLNLGVISLFTRLRIMRKTPKPVTLCFIFSMEEARMKECGLKWDAPT